MSLNIKPQDTKLFATTITYIATLGIGVYLCINDFPCLGGWICILAVVRPFLPYINI